MDQGELKRLSILIVEDDPVVRELIKSATEFLGHLAFPAEDARQASAMLARRTFDRLVVDIMLPGEDGLTWTETAVSTRPDLVPFTTLVSGGALTPEQSARMGRLGVRFLGKPFTLHEFLDAVGLWDLGGAGSPAE